MSNFKYADHEPRVYDQFGLVLPGRVIELEPAEDGTDVPAPDHRWDATSDAATDAPVAPSVVVDGNQYAVAEDEPADEPAPPAPASKPKPTPDPPVVVDDPPAPTVPPADPAPAA